MAAQGIPRDSRQGLSNSKFWLDELSGGLSESFDYAVVSSPADAKALILILPSCDRGRAAVGLHSHRKRIGPTAAYDGIMVAWDHDHRQVVDAFGSPEKFLAALKEVAPRLDQSLPKRIEMWRGAIVSRADTLRSGLGLSWTRSRDIASWFALHDYVPSLQPSLTPVVLHANIDRSIVVATHGSRAEREVIVDISALESCAGGIVTLDGVDKSSAESGYRIGDLRPDPFVYLRLIASWRLASARYERRKRMLESQRRPAQCHKI